MEKIKNMKYREHTEHLLPAAVYIHLWKVTAQPPQPRTAPSIWKRIAAKLLAAKAMLLVACSPSPESPTPDYLGNMNTYFPDPLELVWVHPESAREERAKTLPRVEGNPFQL